MAKHKEKKQRYSRLPTAVGDAVRRADPIGLLEVGAPPDEYDPEVGTILPRLRDAASAFDVAIILHEEFTRWFGAEQAGDLERSRPPAATIWPVLSSIGPI